MVKNAKLWIILGAVVLVAAVTIVLVIVLSQPKKAESYRIIQIYNSEGIVTVDRENVGQLKAYPNMRLQSGDVLTVGTESRVYLKLDSDKYILAEPETVVEIIAEGTPEASKTTINLVKGTIVNRVDSKLNENSSYEINASNSTMAIRGTMVMVSCSGNDDVTAHVKVDVFEGEVEMRPFQAPSTTKEFQKIRAGEGAEIVIKDSMEAQVEKRASADPRILTAGILQFMLTSAQEDSQKYQFDQNMLEEAIQEKTGKAQTSDVTFTVEGTIFAVVRVKKGEKVVCPTIQPTPNGHWKFDFDQPIENDTTIIWEEDPS